MKSTEDSERDAEPPPVFKKPLLIGKVGRPPRRLLQTKAESKSYESDLRPVEEDKATPEADVPVKPLAAETAPLPYEEPLWGGLPCSRSKDYKFEVLKNGSIIDGIDLMDKSYWVFGRLNGCSISLQHPTVSRYHAVLQYRRDSSENEECGFYIYDLGSTHGTFLNKTRLKPRVYTRMQVGHMLKLGCSTRCFILDGPEYDEEEESDLSVTEMKQKFKEKVARRKEAALEEERLEHEKRKREEERGIDWGLGEDAEEETDLSENPYAQTNNEELYLDDPKKALRGFFEREGLDLEYDCTEQGIGQFLCKVELPLDDELGRPIVAEVIHKGKKKETVVQCALEACRILDRYGVLRQATHESRKRKTKNWEENDYYDSDDDTFLDRTGTIEKKREKRMKTKIPQKAETYESLVEKEKSVAKSIADLERSLANALSKESKRSDDATGEDPLDSFMKDLSEEKPDKQSISKMKSELVKLKSEHANLVNLVNIAKPTTVPPLIPQYSMPSGSKETKSVLPIFGKRRKLKVQFPAKQSDEGTSTKILNEGEVEEEEDEEDEKMEESDSKSDTSKVQNVETESSTSSNRTAQPKSKRSEPGTTDFNLVLLSKFETVIKTAPPLFANAKQKLQKILAQLRQIASKDDRMQVDWKTLTAKKRKVMQLMSEVMAEPTAELNFKISTEIQRMLAELRTMSDENNSAIDAMQIIGDELSSISDEIDKDIERKYNDEDGGGGGDSEEMDEKKRKSKNKRRIHQRQEKAEIDKQKGYEEDARREGYDMWMPPDDQTGDGRTSLNDKLGY